MAYKIDANFTPSSYSDNFTMMAWVNPTDSITLKSQSNSGTNSTSGQHYVFGAPHGESTGSAGAGLSVGTNGILVTAHAASYMPPLAVKSVSVSGWHHVAVVFTNKTPSIYLDGALIHTGVQSTKTHVWASNQIGGGAWGAFKGSVDDVRVIPKALTASEIKLLMGEICDDGANNGKSGKCKIDCSGK